MAGIVTANWIQLTSGGGYDFAEKRIFGPFNVKDDVAWPLSCPRFTKHTRVPWPVTLHSVAVARTIFAITGSRVKAAAGLMHDGHEAVIGDITTPVARHVGQGPIQELKEDVQIAMFAKLGIPYDLLPERHPEVKRADEAALIVEKRLLMPPEPRPWSAGNPGVEYLQEMHRQVSELLERNALPAYRLDSTADDGVGEFLIAYNTFVVPLCEGDAT